MEVAVAEFPIRETVALHRLHLHVGRQQVITTVCAVAGGLFHEHLGVITLAGQTPVMVSERDDDGFDLLLRNHFAQTAETQHSSYFALALTQIFPRKIVWSSAFRKIVWSSAFRKIVWSSAFRKIVWSS